jgi:hypothetical protein
MFELGDRAEDLEEHPAEPVELGDHQLVPRPQRPQGRVELGPPGELPRRGVREDPLAAGAGRAQLHDPGRPPTRMPW